MENEPILIYGAPPMSIKKQRIWFYIFLHDVNVKKRRIKLSKVFKLLFKGLNLSDIKKINESVNHSEFVC